MTHSDINLPNKIIKNYSNNVSSDIYNNETDFLLEKILKEQFAVSIGNFIFIPPIENPKVSSSFREDEIKKTSKVIDGYVQVNTKIDDDEMTLLIHMSRLTNENNPPSVSIYNVDAVNEKDLRLSFKNEFPEIFVKTLSTYLNYKKSLEHVNTKEINMEVK